MSDTAHCIALHCLICQIIKSQHWPETQTFDVPPLLRLSLMEPSKKSKLTALGRGSHMSIRGLVRVLNEVKELGVPDVVSKQAYIRERKAEVSGENPYGPIVLQVKGVSKRGQPVD